MTDNLTPPGIPPVFVEAAKEANNEDSPGCKLQGEFDAMVWAKEFCRINTASDEEMMLGWFANAIMAGYDYARNGLVRALEDKPEEITDQDIEDIERRQIEGLEVVGVMWIDPDAQYMATRSGPNLFMVQMMIGGGVSWVGPTALRAMLQNATSIHWPEGHRLAAPPESPETGEGE